jgi:hypothetical protein
MSNGNGAGSNPDGFLNPKSMVTPGAAGALTMMITNTLAKNFGLWPNWTALLISLIIGALVVFVPASSMFWLWKTLLWVVNSLVIFAMATGTNQAGVAIATPADKKAIAKPDQQVAANTPFFSHWLDGTVPLRNQVSSQIASQVSPDQARTALSKLQLPPEVADPVNVLKSYVLNSRTASEVAQVQEALSTAPGASGSSL